MRQAAGSPVINPAAEDEQGRGLSGPRPGGGMGATAPAPIQGPLDASGAREIVGESGLGAQKNLSKSQFPELPEMPGEGAEGAAGGAGELAELAPLALA